MTRPLKPKTNHLAHRVRDETRARTASHTIPTYTTGGSLPIGWEVDREDKKNEKRDGVEENVPHAKQSARGFLVKGYFTHNKTVLIQGQRYARVEWLKPDTPTAPAGDERERGRYRERQGERKNGHQSIRTVK